MILNIKIYIMVMSVVLMFSACATEEAIPEPAPKPVVVEVEAPVVEEKVKEEVKVDLTPLEMCAKEENKYNLIVNAPKNSKIRILNIKPKYKKCIALKKGKYYIEVTKKGYMKYKEWIKIDSDMELDVALIELLKPTQSLKAKNTKKLSKIGFNKTKLQAFIDQCSSEDLIIEAQRRIDIIDKEFYGYSPKYIIGKKDCVGFYPKDLAEKMLNISVPLKYWDSIRWSGGCKNGLMNYRGVIYLKSKKGLHVDLKGKMKNGFFEGRVYNFSRFKAKPEYIRDSGRGYYKIKLKTKEDFKEYQQ